MLGSDDDAADREYIKEFGLEVGFSPLFCDFQSLKMQKLPPFFVHFENK
jgi:hypothetical protein